MDKKILRDLKKALVLESFFSGAASLSKVFAETETELEDMMKYVDKRFNIQKALDGKLFNNGKR
jgi:hypothetical protein